MKKDKSDSNFKLIHSSSGIRVSQACDRCRIKKVRCDGQYPCSNCVKVRFDCKTSDKLTRRAFPKGYTENLEKKIMALEQELKSLKENGGNGGGSGVTNIVSETGASSRSGSSSGVNLTAGAANTDTGFSVGGSNFINSGGNGGSTIKSTEDHTRNIKINNPIDQILNIDNKGIIIGNDNLNFESQFNHLLINLNLPFLKIKNSHNYLINDPNSFLYSSNMNNSDLNLIYSPLTINNTSLPLDIYNLFIKLINSLKIVCKKKSQLDIQIIKFFLNYNIFIPIFDYNQFIDLYNQFHISYPFIFTYNDSSINGFNLSIDYSIIDKYFLLVVQIYIIIFINDESCLLNLNLVNENFKVNSLDFHLYQLLPYFNSFHITIPQLQTYLLFSYYSLLKNNKEKSLILLNLSNSFIGILGINLNSKNLFFNDLSLSKIEKKTRVKNFWSFKILLKCFNLKFGFKPSLNTTVVNPVTIDKYFQLTPEKLSSLLDDESLSDMLKPSIEFLNLMNIIIPSSFSPNYYQYLKKDTKKKSNPKLHWILNDDDGDGNDGNLNYNFNQFMIIDKNLVEWHRSLQSKTIDLSHLQQLNLTKISDINSNNLYNDLKENNQILNHESLIQYYKTGLPDVRACSQLISVQLNFHYNLIRSQNYLNFIVDKELSYDHYMSIFQLSKEVLRYFLLIFNHVAQSQRVNDKPNIVMQSLGLDVDEDGFVINDFSVKRKKPNNNINLKRNTRQVPDSPFNVMMNGLSLTIISLKKSILLQMVYSYICLMKFVKRNEYDQIPDSLNLIRDCIQLFIKSFISYEPSKVRPKDDEIYKKLLNDEFKDDILRDEDDNEEEDTFYSMIDWDDEEMHEDLKYLKILKSILYKTESMKKRMEQRRHNIPENFNHHKNQQNQQNQNSLYNHNQYNQQNHKPYHHSQVRQDNQEYNPISPHSTQNMNLPHYSEYNKPINSNISTPQYYEGSSPNLNYKIPLVNKLDYSMTDGYRQYHNQGDTVKKEKLVINDLVNMKNNQWGNNQ